MRAFLEIFRFECRFQAKSPLYIALSVLFFLIHFLTARKLGINIGIGANQDTATIPLNAAVAIIQNELVLSLFAIFPAVAVVAATITRDHERRMTELFFVRPIREPSYLLGRFAGGLAFVVIASLAGVLGGLVALTTPGVDPARLGPFAAASWWFAVGAVAVPNTVIVATVVFSAAAAARSIAAAFCAAIVLAVLPFIAQGLASPDNSTWLPLVDPFGVLAIVDVTAFWTGAELATDLPGGVLLVNRALWLGVAAASLVAVLARYRFVVHGTSPRLWRGRASAEGRVPPLSGLRAAPQFGSAGTIAQLKAQLTMDLRAILRSPPFYLVLALVVLNCAQHFAAPPANALIGPSAPLTSLMIGFLDIGIAIQLLLFVAYYAGVLVHRARETRVADIADASPVSSAIGVLGKVGALCAALTLLLAAGVVTFIVLQAASGYTRIELGLYLKGLIFYGFSHYMLVVPAVLIHLLFQNRWLGTLAFLAAFAAVPVLLVLGFEDLLYTFRLPAVIHSDMNGFGHFVVRHASLMAYWSAFLALATVGAYLIAPRGYYDRLAHRLADARSRVTRPTVAVAAAAAIACVALGAWIFYNTHVLNEYVTGRDLETRDANYEKKFRRYAGLAYPRPTALDLQIDFFPSERRVESRGTAQLVNDTGQPIREVFVSLNPELTVNSLELGAAELIDADAGAGGRLYRFPEPLQAGATVTQTWDFSWRNDGFANSMRNGVVENGTYLDAPTVMPVFRYDPEREITDTAVRRRHGLPTAGRLPDLDDPEARRDPRFGFAPADVRAVLSTSEDQTAVAAGSLQREWREGGRRYFEYRSSYVVGLVAASARYEVARDSVNGIAIEIFHDPKHVAAVPTIMNTVKGGLDYYTREFGPYIFDTFRIFEYPRYATVVDARAGVIAFTEGAGFFSEFRDRDIDFVTAHELGHMWWGAQVRSQVLQGMFVLNETMSSYSAVMLAEHVDGRAAAYRQVIDAARTYFDTRSRQPIEELPIVRSESAIAGTKGIHVMYALRDLLGADRLHLALRRFIEKYGNRLPPNPTTRELVAEIRAVVTDDRHQALITDWLERITLYDVAVTEAQQRADGDAYEVTIEIAARQLDVDGAGVETEVPLNAPFDVAVFVAGAAASDEPIYLEKHWLTSGPQRIVVRVPARAGRVAVDPYGLMLDRRAQDNDRAL